ncbi:MAG: hypothetical protein M0031_01620 [Thermaerobacter sp.]|jgi:hypothetical protein|nr:hypothetical protein [Thermaerobacter sp.]
MLRKWGRLGAALSLLALLAAGCAPPPPAPPITLQDVPGVPVSAAFAARLARSLAHLPHGRWGWSGFAVTENGNYNSHTCQYCYSETTFSVQADHGRYLGQLFTPLYSQRFYYARHRLYREGRKGWHLVPGRQASPDPLGRLAGLNSLAGTARRLPDSHVGPVLCRVYALDTTAGKLSSLLGPGGKVLAGQAAAAPARVILWIGHGNAGRYAAGNGRLYQLQTYVTVPVAGRPGLWQASRINLSYEGPAVRAPRKLPRANLLP